MVPLRLIPRLFMFDEAELAPDLRAQRTLNRSRIPAIAKYLLGNRTSYVFSAITASVDAEVRFEPLREDAAGYNVGLLLIPMNARLVLNDGQHRRAAIELALRSEPALGEETIPCVIYEDSGLRRAQQMFADLNRYPVRTNSALNILYDHRDLTAALARRLTEEVEIFRGFTEMDRASISNRSTKLFTLSGIYRATKELVGECKEEGAALQLASTYWNELTKWIVPWRLLLGGKTHAADLRREYIVAHGVALVAFGRVGRALLEQQTDWKRSFQHLENVDWSRDNAAQWEGRATVGGRISIASNHVTLLSNELKNILGLPLDEAEQVVEDQFRKGKLMSEAKVRA
jgi:DNA sulfur modification protein DndB